MAEVIFKGAKVQKGDRIKIPKAVIDTLNIKTGDKLTIKFNPDKKNLTINIQ